MQPTSPRNTIIPLDDRCLEIWQQLQKLIAEVLCVDVERVTMQSRLFADLGAA